MKGTAHEDFQLGYSPALDGIRGLSILAVMGFNAHLSWLRGGFAGVDIFFVLSGFLITALLVQEFGKTSRIGLRTFYFRRALRLLPALFVLMSACLAYAFIFQTAEASAVTLAGVVYTLFYVANWAQVPPNLPGIGPLSHAWSLSVEEQFYIVWPLLLLILLKRRSKVQVFVVLGLLIVISIILNTWFWQSGVSPLRMYFGTDTRANEILIGCTAALLLCWNYFRSEDRFKWVFHVAAMLGLAIIFSSFFVFRHNEALAYNGGFVIISVATSFVILDFLLFPSIISRCFEVAPLVWIGKISYSLYLWHFPIFEASRKLFEGRMSRELYTLIGVAVTVLVSAASYHIIERPFLKLKLRLGAEGIPPGAAGPSQMVAGA